MATTSDDPRPGADGDGTACAACGHDMSGHDAMAQRFCRISHDRGLERGCICRTATEIPKPAEPAEAPMYGRGRFSGR